MDKDALTLLILEAEENIRAHRMLIEQEKAAIAELRDRGEDASRAEQNLSRLKRALAIYSYRHGRLTADLGE